MRCFEEKNGEPEPRSSSLKLKDLPKKFKDPGSFNIPMLINDSFVANALLDLGSIINLTPLTMLRWVTWRLNPTRCSYNWLKEL